MPGGLSNFFSGSSHSQRRTRLVLESKGSQIFRRTSGLASSVVAVVVRAEPPPVWSMLSL